jgi:hypothetical protein
VTPKNEKLHQQPRHTTAKKEYIPIEKTRLNKKTTKSKIANRPTARI